MEGRCGIDGRQRDERRREAFRRWAGGRRGKGDEPSGREPPIEEVPTGVWLVIRYDEGDAGARPIPDGDVFWASPDIWITGGDADGNAIAGQPTGVHARVWNFGSFLAAPVRVDFRFVAPSIGIPWSAPQLIGSAWVNVPPLGTEVADCPVPWIPADTGLTHACLIVTCNAPVMDPPDQPGNVRDDRKTAQRNVTVVQAAAGETMRFGLQFARTANARGSVRIGAMMVQGQNLVAAPGRGTGALTRVLRTLIGRAGTAEAAPLARRALALHLDRDRAKAGPARLLPARQTSELVRAEAGDLEPADLPPVADRGVGAGLVPLGLLAAAEPLRPTELKVQVKVPKVDGDLALHLLQIEDDAVTGGYTILIRPRR